MPSRYYAARCHCDGQRSPASSLRRLRGGLFAEVVARQHRHSDGLNALFLRVRQQLQQRRQRFFLLLARRVLFCHLLSLPFFPSLPNLCYTVWNGKEVIP